MDPKTRIEAYFDACNGGDAEAIASHFCDDAVVYDTNHAPVRGAATIGRFWTKIREKWGDAFWHVDACIASGDSAAIEWTFSGVHSERGRFCARGSEHYRMRDTRIAEIRQYWTFDPDSPAAALHGFPYGERAGFWSPELRQHAEDTR